MTFTLDSLVCLLANAFIFSTAGPEGKGGPRLEGSHRALRPRRLTNTPDKQFQIGTVCHCFLMGCAHFSGLSMESPHSNSRPERSRTLDLKRHNPNGVGATHMSLKI